MTAFVLGNGISRQAVPVPMLMQHGTVYGCNAIYREHEVHVLVATDHPIANTIQRSGYSSQHRFYTRRPVPDLGGLSIPAQYFGFSSGPIAVSLAALDHQPRIYMLGFDLGPDEAGRFNNVYAGTEFYKNVGAAPTFTGNWIKQILKILADFPQQQFLRVCGPTTNSIKEFAVCSNYSEVMIEDFLDRINTLKDL